jgi:hypothetical protein
MPGSHGDGLVRSNFRNISAAATTVVKSGSGVLVSIVVNKAVANSTITIYDNTAASGTKIGTITTPATLLHSQYPIPYNVAFSNGLTIVTSAADDITVTYN